MQSDSSDAQGPLLRLLKSTMVKQTVALADRCILGTFTLADKIALGPQRRHACGKVKNGVAAVKAEVKRHLIEALEATAPPDLKEEAGAVMIAADAASWRWHGEQWIKGERLARHLVNLAQTHISVETGKRLFAQALPLELARSCLQSAHHIASEAVAARKALASSPYAPIVPTLALRSKYGVDSDNDSDSDDSLRPMETTDDERRNDNCKSKHKPMVLKLPLSSRVRRAGIDTLTPRIDAEANQPFSCRTWVSGEDGPLSSRTWASHQEEPLSTYRSSASTDSASTPREQANVGHTSRITKTNAKACPSSYRSEKERAVGVAQPDTRLRELRL